VGGSFASGALFSLLNLAHTKALSNNTEDLHGSARWATKADIEGTNLIQAKQGVYVGGWHERSIKHLHYLRHNGPEHRNHPTQPDGIRYRSRHAPERTAYAIYTRSPATFSVSSIGSFTDPANEDLFKLILKTYKLAFI